MNQIAEVKIGSSEKKKIPLDPEFLITFVEQLYSSLSKEEIELLEKGLANIGNSIPQGELSKVRNLYEEQGPVAAIGMLQQYVSPDDLLFYTGVSASLFILILLVIFVLAQFDPSVRGDLTVPIYSTVF